MENIGQITDQNGVCNKDVKYVLTTPFYNVSFYSDHFAYEVFSNSINDTSQVNVERIELWFDTKNNNSIIITNKPTNDVTNVYKNGKSFTGIKGFKSIKYLEVWEGVDIEFSIQKNQLKYNYIVKNKQIKTLALKVKGASVHQQNQDILLQGKTVFIRETIPECYFTSLFREKEIAAIQLKTNPQSIQLQLPPNREHTLIIDPLAYGEQYTTYYGGTHMDFIHSIKTTKTNEVVIAGFTLSTNNIATTGAYQSTISTQDAFIAKFDSQGNRLWGTYFGGDAEERVYSMALDTNDNIIIAGSTTSIMGLATVGSQQQNIASSDDAFIAQFTPSGQLVWSTYLGGNNHELVTDIEIDNLNKIYVTGHTSSTNLPCSPNAFRNTLSGFENVFLGIYSNAGTMLYNSYYMNGSSNRGEGIAITPNGNIYLCGTTNDTSVFTNSTVHQTQNGGYLDGFILKISPTLNTIWSTYLGGWHNELVRDICLDSLENLYIVGKTKSNNQVATTGSYQSVYSNDWDGFVVKLDSSSTRLWGTYIGGSLIEELTSVSQVDSTLWVLGFTNGNPQITDSSAIQANNNGGSDNIIIQFNLNGNKKWGTYLGGNSNEYAFDLTMDNSNSFYIAGQTASSLNFTTTNAHQSIYGGHSYDGFWSKICKPLSPTILSGTGEIFVCDGDTITLYSVNNFASYNWNTGENTSSISVFSSGNYVLNTLDTNNCPGRSDTLKVSIIPIDSISITSSSTILCHNDSVYIDVGAGYSSYLWNNGNVSAGQYVIDTGYYSTTVVDNHGCIYHSDTLSIMSSTYSYSIEIIGDTIICINGSSILYTPQTFNQLTWNTGETNTSIVADTTGTYSFIGFDSNNCPIISDSISITEVNYTTSSLVLDTVTSFTICWNDTIHLTAENNFSFYAWSNGDSLQTTAITLEGSYYVTATDSNGCVGVSDSIQLNHYNNGLTLVNAPLGLSFCQGDSLFLIADTSLNNTTWNNQFLFSDTLLTDSSGSYFFTAIDTSNCSVYSDTVNVIKNNLPVVEIDPIQDSICIGDSLFILCQSPFLSNYNWSNGEVDSAFYIIFNTAGSQPLFVEASGVDNCINSDTITINVVNCVFEGIKDKFTKPFIITPNPATDIITIQFYSTLNYVSIEIINIQGEIVIANKKTKIQSFEMDISNLASGIYSVKVTSENHTTSLKFIKE